MTQQEKSKEKELLLNVLKDGLPYGLQLQIIDVNSFTFNGELRVLSKNWCRLYIADPVIRKKVKNRTIPLNYIYIKPYLRPMSSMTEEERKEYEKFSHFSIGLAPILMDWIYSHHLDCCGLIEKGLALEAPNDMYETNKK